MVTTTVQVNELDAVANLLNERQMLILTLAAFAPSKGSYRTWFNSEGQRYPNHFFVVLNLDGNATVFMVKDVLWWELEHLDIKEKVVGEPSEEWAHSIKALEEYALRHLQEMTYTVQIGNSDNKLTDGEWEDFISEVNGLIEKQSDIVHFHGLSPEDKPWTNATWVFNTSQASAKKLRATLSSIKQKYYQDSIAWTQGKTEFI